MILTSGITSATAVELQDQIAELLRKCARESERQRVTAKMVKTDRRFPVMLVILRAFDAKKFDDVLRAVGLWPEHPTHGELVRSLRRFYVKNNRVPTLKDAENGGLPYSVNTYTRSSGSWNNMLNEAGLPYRRATGGWKAHDPRWDNVTKKEAARYLRETFGATGFLPPMMEYEAGNYFYPTCVYIRLFHTWGAAARTAGLQLVRHLPTNSPSRVPDEDLLLWLMIEYEDTKILPSAAQFRKSNPKYSYAQYCKRFGGWRKVAELIGYRLASDVAQEKYDPDRAILYLMVRYETTGILPTAKAYKASNPEYSYELYIKLFKTWRRTAKLAGLRLASNPSEDLTNLNMAA